MRKNGALQQVKALLQTDVTGVHQDGVRSLFQRGDGAVAVLIVALLDICQHRGEVGGLALLGQLHGAALGAGLGVWGVINLLEGYGNDNPGAKSQGMKQLMAGAGVAVVGLILVPLLSGLFTV